MQKSAGGEDEGGGGEIPAIMKPILPQSPTTDNETNPTVETDIEFSEMMIPINRQVNAFFFHPLPQMNERSVSPLRLDTPALPHNYSRSQSPPKKAQSTNFSREDSGWKIKSTISESNISEHSRELPNHQDHASNGINPPESSPSLHGEELHRPNNDQFNDTTNAPWTSIMQSQILSGRSSSNDLNDGPHLSSKDNLASINWIGNPANIETPTMVSHFWSLRQENVEESKDKHEDTHHKSASRKLRNARVHGTRSRSHLRHKSTSHSEREQNLGSSLTADREISRIITTGRDNCFICHKPLTGRGRLRNCACPPGLRMMISSQTSTKKRLSRSRSSKTKGKRQQSSDDVLVLWQNQGAMNESSVDAVRRGETTKRVRSESYQVDGASVDTVGPGAPKRQRRSAGPGSGSPMTSSQVPDPKTHTCEECGRVKPKVGWLSMLGRAIKTLFLGASVSEYCRVCWRKKSLRMLAQETLSKKLAAPRQRRQRAKLETVKIRRNRSTAARRINRNSQKSNRKTPNQTQRRTSKGRGDPR